MLYAGSSFKMCLRNYSIINQQNTGNSMNYFNYGVERCFTDRFMLSSVLSTAAASSELIHSTFVDCILILLNFILDYRANMLPSHIEITIIFALLL